jgi:hypothetical protein
MVKKTIGDVRKLGSNLHASLVTPGSTRRGKRNGKVNVDDGVMDAPDTACRCSPMSSHVIAHLRDYANRPERKTKRAKRKLEEISKAWKIEIEDKANGHTYQSRMAAPTVEGIEVSPNRGAEESSTPFCRACGNYGHQRRTSKKCTKNPSNKHYQGTYVDRLCEIVACAVSKYSYSASLNVSTHLSYNLYV